MTPEQKRIAIAEACGWREIFAPSEFELLGKLEPVSMGRDYFDVPNYFSNLNAMHEAEKVLTHPQRIEYLRHLTALDHYGRFATAAQRAEAFGLTLNLWK